MIPSPFTPELARQHRAELAALAARRPPRRTAPSSRRLGLHRLAGAIRAPSPGVGLGPAVARSATC